MSSSNVPASVRGLLDAALALEVLLGVADGVLPLFAEADAVDDALFVVVADVGVGGLDFRMQVGGGERAVAEQVEDGIGDDGVLGFAGCAVLLLHQVVELALGRGRRFAAGEGRSVLAAGVGGVAGGFAQVVGGDEWAEAGVVEDVVGDFADEGGAGDEQAALDIVAEGGAGEVARGDDGGAVVGDVDLGVEAEDVAEFDVGDSAVRFGEDGDVERAGAGGAGAEGGGDAEADIAGGEFVLECAPAVFRDEGGADDQAFAGGADEFAEFGFPRRADDGRGHRTVPVMRALPRAPKVATRKGTQ